MDLKEQFLLNGAFCGLAIVYGVSTLMIGLKLYGVGWPQQYADFYKRYVFRRRNRRKARYSPRLVKREVRLLCALLDMVLLFTAILVIPIYLYGILATAPDLMRLIALVFSKLF